MSDEARNQAELRPSDHRTQPSIDPEVGVGRSGGDGAYPTSSTLLPTPHLQHLDSKAVARFEEKVDRSAGPDGCHPWQASLDSSGYGKFKLAGKLVPAHKVAAVLDRREDVPAGSEVHHSCRERACCNPRHLAVTDRPGNMAHVGAPCGQHPEAMNERPLVGRYCSKCFQTRDRAHRHRKEVAPLPVEDAVRFLICVGQAWCEQLEVPLRLPDSKDGAKRLRRSLRSYLSEMGDERTAELSLRAALQFWSKFVELAAREHGAFRGDPRQAPARPTISVLAKYPAAARDFWARVDPVERRAAAERRALRDRERALRDREREQEEFEEHCARRAQARREQHEHDEAVRREVSRLVWYDSEPGFLDADAGRSTYYQLARRVLLDRGSSQFGIARAYASLFPAEWQAARLPQTARRAREAPAGPSTATAGDPHIQAKPARWAGGPGPIRPFALAKFRSRFLGPLIGWLRARKTGSAENPHFFEGSYEENAFLKPGRAAARERAPLTVERVRRQQLEGERGEAWERRLEEAAVLDDHGYHEEAADLRSEGW